MILVDSSVGSKELYPLIRNHGVQCELAPLHAADFCFEGLGPTGSMLIGIERKTLHDMLDCIEYPRYCMQRIKMSQMYSLSFLAIEGSFRPHEDGTIMELYRNQSWGRMQHAGRPVMYAKLNRYLISVALSNVIVTYSRDKKDTAYNVVELYHYFQKKWEDHTSMIQTQKLNIATFDRKPSLVRRWASELPGIGVKYGMAAEGYFKTPYRLAMSDETDWLKLPGLGTSVSIKAAQEIIREIHGWGK